MVIIHNVNSGWIILEIYRDILRHELLKNLSQGHTCNVKMMFYGKQILGSQAEQITHTYN